MTGRASMKFSYRGILQFITCDLSSHYEDVIDIVMERYNIPANCKRAVEIFNEHGYMFEKEIFEYFILLFPKPEIIFYIRVDYSQIWSNFCAHTRYHLDDGRVPFGMWQENAILCDLEDDYPAVAVHRQNCFLGAMPHNAAAQKRRQEAEFARAIAKRLRVEDEAKRLKQLKAIPKRSFRI